MKKALAIFVVCFASRLATADDPLATVHGVRLGASEREAVAVLKDLVCKRASDGGRTCKRAAAIGDVRVDELFMFTDDHLLHVSMTFPTPGYPAMKDTLLLKYGAPTDAQTEKLKNLIGGEFDNETLRWIGEAAVVTVQRWWRTGYESALGMKGMVGISDRKTYDADMAALEEKRKKAAKDF